MLEGFDLAKMQELLKNVQEKAKEAEQEALNKEYTVKSGAGMVAIKVSGSGEVLDLDIDESLMSDKESLQILLISAMNDAIKLIENEKKQMAAKMLGNFGGLQA